MSNSYRLLPLSATQSPRADQSILRRFSLAKWQRHRIFVFSLLALLSLSVLNLLHPIVPALFTRSIDWDDRADQVRKSFLYAYSNYERYAYPHDELLPLSASYVDNFNGWGVSIIDSLDTMYLMGLTPQFKRGLLHVAAVNFTLPTHVFAPFFETTIRYLGGLLSAYALSGEPLLLARADELGEALLPVFSSPSGLPYFGINPKTGQPRHGAARGRILFAEIASCQIEYKYLAHLTGKTKYFHAVDKIIGIMEKGQREDGMWSTFWNTSSGEQLNDHVSVGAWADSSYEYLLKGYLLSNRTETRLMSLFKSSTKGILQNLLYLSPTRSLLYPTDLNRGYPSGRFEHLSCFYPGLLAIGVPEIYPLDPALAEKMSWAAEGMAWSCYIMYGDQVQGGRGSGLGPDEARMDRVAYNKTLHGLGGEGGGERQDVWEKKNGRWWDIVEEWKRESKTAGRWGKMRGKPPGVGNLASVWNTETKKDGVKRDYVANIDSYLLRPETIESIYIMWRTTRDPIWREKGWEIFQSLERTTRQKNGYASVLSVAPDPDRGFPISNEKTSKPMPVDSMPSYALAETWKYLFLLFKEDDPVPMDRWVFNTEAHPLPVFDWKDWEKAEYGIRS
ncbi:seven-hairpin glycosidase [Sistotremastrum suecicum HHB10207 ss-3]|uniref:alpha-1,2-Mannosidase n=1 Tax=Sistotremastrum suecicum HHB10207 ss-3 TaxID=1314776 RepID=A0A166GFQ7_9AGAM|nr:seven-hairpin glycosidase [Sistotremastrum suecicum HHB10207 ss-3]